MSDTDQEPRAVAIKAAIQAELPAGVTVYDVDEVPGTEGGPSSPTNAPPARYVSIELSRRWTSKQRGGGSVSVPLGALTTHYRAPNVTDARALREDVRAALETRAYALPDGDTVGPFTFQIDGGITGVAGGWSGYDTWNL